MNNTEFTKELASISELKNRIKKSVCRIYEPALSSYQCTGWLCSVDGWIISAGHLFVNNGVVFDKQSTTNTRSVLVTFPSMKEQEAELLYAEKNDEQGIDFAIVRLCNNQIKIRPLLCADCSDHIAGEVHITGLDSLASGAITGYDGKIQSEMISLTSGNEGFLHITAENAVQEGYSGSPVFSYDAEAVIGIQTMASTSGLKSSTNVPPVAGRSMVAVMPIFRMLERYTPLKKHIKLSKRPFSGIKLLEMLKQYSSHSYTRKRHQCFDDRSIDEIILPRIEEQKKTTGELKDLSQPILDAVERMKEKNCYILGEQGGCGKTVALFKLFSRFMRKCNGVGFDNKIPIYVELRNLAIGKREIGKLIPAYLGDIFFEIDSLSDSRDHLLYDLWNELNDPSIEGTKFILLLDGLNEVTLSKRRIVIDEIRYWAQQEHIQVIVTSRYKEDQLVENKDEADSYDSFEILTSSYQGKDDRMFQLFTIQKLKTDVILSYLEFHGFTSEAIQQVLNNKDLLDILCIPMYLTIFTRFYREHLEKPLCDICTKGQLLNEFFGDKETNIINAVSQKSKLKHQGGFRVQSQSELNDIISKKLFVLYKILPYIAFRLASSPEHALGIRETELHSLIDELFARDSFMAQRAKLPLFSMRYNKYAEINTDWRETAIADGFPKIGNPTDWIISIIIEELHILRTVLVNQYDEANGPSAWCPSIVIYEFLHENLRDYFAAIQMREDIFYFTGFGIEPSVSLTYPNIPHTVLEFLGNLCEEHSFKPRYDYSAGKWLASDPQRKLEHSFIENTFSRLRGKHEPVYQSIVANLVEVMKYSRNNDLSGVDFHDLDFSKTWLGGINFSRVIEGQVYASRFDGAVIQRSNLIRSGHDYPIVCIRRDAVHEDIIYSVDKSGRIIRWSLKTGLGENVCSLETGIRDIVLSTDNQLLYAASEHDIYRVGLSDSSITHIYTTKAFICSLSFSNKSLFYKTDTNPVVWIELLFDQNGNVISRARMDSSVTLWMCGSACESRDRSWIITGGFSKASRVQVFHKLADGNWDRKPVQTLPLPFGHHMTSISMSRDETRVLLCVDKFLYEYSINVADKVLNTELTRYSNYAGCSFADYLYNNKGEQAGIICAEGKDIVIRDNDFQPCNRFIGGNDNCYLSFPIKIEREPYLRNGSYRFSTESWMDRRVYEKYLLYTGLECQEFDADTDVCSRIYKTSKSTLGYNAEDRELYRITKNGHGVFLKDSQGEQIDDRVNVYVDYVEMKGTVSYRIQRYGRKIIIHEKYTNEQEEFMIYNGLIIQGCSMKNLKGEMNKPENLEILRRYGAIT